MVLLNKGYISTVIKGLEIILLFLDNLSMAKLNEIFLLDV